MASIEEMNKSMTIFYSKQTGEIKAFSTGIQDMSFFGENRIDYEIIYDFIVIEKDNYVIENTNNFKIENKRLKLKETIDMTRYL